MATSQMSEVIQHLRRVVLLRNGAGLTDGQLLEDYISRRDEAALAALVQRHAPMVWGGCRRILHSYQDAEDAFQTTFLVLVRKATSIASRELLAGWLHGVAQQTALKARATATRRKGRERQMLEMPEPAAVDPDLRDDLQPLLDRELSRLPDGYRNVIILCDLEGKTRKEAARQLDWPEGTVAGRLARARALLAERLTRHGRALLGGSLGVLLAQNAVSAQAPASLVSSTITAASLFAADQAAVAGVITPSVAALTEGVLRMMLLSKLKVATAMLVAVVFLGVGVASFRQQSRAQQPAEKPVQAKVKDGKEDARDPNKKVGKKETDEESILGVVQAVDAAKSTITITPKGRGDITFAVQKDATVEVGGKAAKLADVPVGARAVLHWTQIVQKLQVVTGPVNKEGKPKDPGKKPVKKPASSEEPSKKPVKKPASPEDPTKKPVKKPASPEDPAKKPLKKPASSEEPSKKPVKKPASSEDPTKKPVKKPGAPTDKPKEVKKGPGSSFGGEVTAVNAAGNTVTIKVKGRDMTFTVLDDVTVEIDGKPGKLADVPVGARVRLHVMPAIRNIQAAEAEAPGKAGK